ncbi:MAG: ion transporter [Spirochaetes bacterium]|nr:ion transporter [Spirochaetota bacterium]
MKSKKIWENFILVAIFLVIVQTFLDDYSRYQHWSIPARNMLLLTGLLFDLIFSIEFIVRTLLANKKGQVLRYWLYGRGWVDFLSSIPLLLFNSGPGVYLLLSGRMEEGAGAIATLNILKIVKAIRVTRILRLIRIMKIFGKIHNAESKMAQRHTSTIATTAVFTIIIVLVISSFFTGQTFERALNSRTKSYNNMIQSIKNINNTMEIPLRPLMYKLFSGDVKILRAHYEDLLVFSRISEEKFNEFYRMDDYLLVENDSFRLFVSVVDINKQISAFNLQSFFIIVILVFTFMIIYTKHFVQTISDIIHIIRRGLTEKDYNLQVKIREEFSEDEIFKLAEYYNDVYLPEKLRKQQEEKEKKGTVLSMDDLMDFK